MMSPTEKKRLKELRKKREKKEYYHTDALREINANWNICFGLRSNGKSYAFKKEIVLKDALDARDEKDIDKKNRFFYIRRYHEDLGNFAVLKWLEDMCVVPEGATESPIMELSEGQFNSFDVVNNKIFAIYREPEKGEVIDRYHIGYFLGIADAERIKSQSYLDVKNILFEEFVATSKPYVSSREPEWLENIASTVDRERGTTKIWLVANNQDRDNLFFRWWGLSGIKNQKEGTIDVYEKIVDAEEGQPKIVKFAVEYCPNIRKSSEGIFFGKGAELNSGQWRSDSHPLMRQEDADKLDVIYEMFVEYHDLKYYCKLLLSETEDSYFWYVKPWNRTIPDGVRLISDRESTQPMTTSNLNPLYPAEKKFFDLIQNGKVWFSDNLTGTEFCRSMKFFALNNKIYNREGY